MLKKTPRSERIHIGIFGKTNSGKSSLLNALTQQEVSIVSPLAGTTTDPVEKRFELLDTAPVIFIDTAGFDDNTALSKHRLIKTQQSFDKTDIALILQSVDQLDYEWFKSLAKECKKKSIPYFMIFTKCDLCSSQELTQLKQQYPDAYFVSTKDPISIEKILQILSEQINLEQNTIPLLGDKISYGAKVILVIPIDSEAPKGRIIHPQVQIIRECLDHGIEVSIVRDTELELALKRCNYNVDLVITDSQVFGFVSKLIPDNILLTSFSIIFSRYKGELDYFIAGINALEAISPQDSIAIVESCSHNISCEDIGRFKIPKALDKHLGFTPHIDFFMGQDFPQELTKYKLIIHCGACMTNRQEIVSRITKAKAHHIPITNYGIFLAYMSGILPRAIEIFTESKKIL